MYLCKLHKIILKVASYYKMECDQFLGTHQSKCGRYFLELRMHSVLEVVASRRFIRYNYSLWSI